MVETSFISPTEKLAKLVSLKEVSPLVIERGPFKEYRGETASIRVDSNNEVIDLPAKSFRIYKSASFVNAICKFYVSETEMMAIPEKENLEKLALKFDYTKGKLLKLELPNFNAKVILQKNSVKVYNSEENTDTLAITKMFAKEIEKISPTGEILIKAFRAFSFYQSFYCDCDFDVERIINEESGTKLKTKSAVNIDIGGTKVSVWDYGKVNFFMIDEMAGHSFIEKLVGHLEPYVLEKSKKKKSKINI